MPIASGADSLRQMVYGFMALGAMIIFIGIFGGIIAGTNNGVNWGFIIVGLLIEAPQVYLLRRFRKTRWWRFGER